MQTTQSRLNAEEDELKKLAKLRKQLDPLAEPKSRLSQLEAAQKDLQVRLKALRARATSIRAKDHAEAGREAADVAILLHRLVALMGSDLSAEVDAKMQINRARKWKAAGDGTGGHV